MTLSRLAIACLPVAAAAPSAVASEGGGGLGEALITPQLGTFFWTLVTFLIVAWILRRYAWKPLLGALDSRENAIRESIDQAQQDREDAQKLLREHKELVAEARRERAAALEAGRADAEKLRAEILAEAGKQRQQLLDQTDEQIQAGLRQARGELRGMAVDLAIRAAEKLLVTNLDDATQRRLVEDYLAGLDESKDSSSPPS